MDAPVHKAENRLPDTRLRGQWIVWARTGWFALAGFATFLFVAALPTRFGQLLLTTPYGNIDFVQRDWSWAFT